MFEAAINNNGRLQIAYSGTPNWMGGFAYVGSRLLVSEDANAASDSFVSGLRVAPSGALRVSYGSPDLIKAGLGVTNDGRLCLTAEAPSYNIGRIGVDSQGLVSIAGVDVVQNGELIDGATFTNATADRSYFDSNGLLQTVAANVPRTAYIGGEPYLWIDGAVTELSGRSNDLSTSSWNDSTTATSTQNAVGLTGDANTAWTVEDSSAAATQQIGDTVLISSSDSVYYRVFAIPYDASPSVYPRCYMSIGGGSAVTETICFDPSDGSYVEVNNSGDVVLVVRIGNFWHIVLSCTDNESGNTAVVTLFQPAYNTDGSVTVNVAAQGSTVCAYSGLFKDNFSLMPVLSTGGSTKSVAADVCTLPVGSWYNQLQGSVLAEVWSPQVVSSANRNIFQFIADGNERWNGQRLSTEKDRMIVVEDGGTLVNIASSGDLTAGTLQKLGFGMEKDNHAFYRDGSQIGTDTNGDAPSIGSSALLYIGEYSSSPSFPL